MVSWLVGWLAFYTCFLFVYVFVVSWFGIWGCFGFSDVSGFWLVSYHLVLVVF